MKTRLFFQVALIVGMMTAVVLVPRNAFAVAAEARLGDSVSFACGNVTEIPQNECAALVTLYNDTSGPGWLDSTSWLVSNTPCNWYGVACTGAHVTSLVLSFNQLSGSIPPELANLSALQELALSANQLSGSIPPELGDLSALESLYLGANHLSGGIPPELGALTNLWGLFLYSNQLSGSIPPELGALANLEILDLSENQLSGAIPPALGGMANLLWLVLYGNQLSGHVPPGLGSLTSLQNLDLSTNSLGGALPQPLTALPLTALDYGGTSLCSPPDAVFQAWLAGIANLSGTGFLCGPKATSVLITKDANDVVLEWTHEEPNTGYEVYSAVTPYFTPGAGTLVATLPSTTTMYRHTGAGGAANNHFYIVRSKFQDSANNLSADSNPTGKFSYSLAPGS